MTSYCQRLLLYYSLWKNQEFYIVRCKAFKEPLATEVLAQDIEYYMSRVFAIGINGFISLCIISRFSD